MGSNPYLPIQIDEDNVADFTDGNRSATIVLNMFKSKDIKECKKEFLPLQHTELWGQWSELEKRMRRTNCDYAFGMNEIRSSQTKIVVSPFMKEVINQLRNLRRKPKATDIFLHIIELFSSEPKSEKS